MKQLRDERLEQAGIRHDAVLLELSKIAFANLDDLRGEDGRISLDALESLPREKFAAISQITLEETDEVTEREGKSGSSVKTTKGRKASVKLFDKRAALVNLGDHLGIWAPTKIAPTTPDGEQPYESAGTAQSTERLAALITSVLERGRARAAGAGDES